MLTSIDADQLTRHAGRIQKIADRMRNIRRGCTAFHNGARPLRRKMFAALTCALHGRPRPDRIDPDRWRKRLCAGFGQRPKSNFRKGIRREMRCQFPHPLVNHIQDKRIRGGFIPRIVIGRLGRLHSESLS